MTENILDEYDKALKLGEKAFRAAKDRGEYPYLPALDEFLPASRIQSQVEMGLMDIPLDQIEGTKTAGRQNSFACNFMPLLKEKSEFAQKWANVYAYQMEEGINDPIVAYEFMNKYYVLEGNKRVSVMKYLGAFSIEGIVTRIVPRYSDDPQVHIFYEYMGFYARTAINYIWFTKEGSFNALCKACSIPVDREWTVQERRDFSSVYQRFQKLCDQKVIKKLNMTVGDVLLFYLDVYPYAQMEDKTDAQIRAELDKLRPELEVLPDAPDEALVMDPNKERERRLFTRFFQGTGSKQLKIAFIHDKPAADSGWVYGHDLGRMHLEQVFGDLVCTTAYYMSNPESSAEGVIESAIEDGNHIVFTTSERMLNDSLKAAIAHPKIKILNCSVNRPYRSLRTYYGRMYEAKYLEGLIAGAMSRDGKIAYAADYPIYGSLANINAFALGAGAVNPYARIYLHWNCVEGADLNRMISEEQIRMVSDIDMLRPGSRSRRFGLYLLDDDNSQTLAAPIWNWGKFYEKIVRDIASGFWKEDTKVQKAVNYWWGISGDIIDLIMSKRVPDEIQKLTRLVRSSIYSNQFHPFEGVLYRQDGSTIGEEGKALAPEQIITMDWLNKNVIGELPAKETLNRSAISLMQTQGIYSVD